MAIRSTILATCDAAWCRSWSSPKAVEVKSPDDLPEGWSRIVTRFEGETHEYVLCDSCSANLGDNKRMAELREAKTMRLKAEDDARKTEAAARVAAEQPQETEQAAPEAPKAAV